MEKEVHKKIKDYAKRNIQKGYHPEGVRKALIKAGHHPSIVNRVIEDVRSEVRKVESGIKNVKQGVMLLSFVVLLMIGISYFVIQNETEDVYLFTVMEGLPNTDLVHSFYYVNVSGINLPVNEEGACTIFTKTLSSAENRFTKEAIMVDCAAQTIKKENGVWKWSAESENKESSCSAVLNEEELLVNYVCVYFGSNLN